MSRNHLPIYGIAGVLTMLLLVACGNTGNPPTSEALSATSPPEEAFASNALRAGDMAPDFTLPDSNGNIVQLADQLQMNEMVGLVFYHTYT